MAKQTLTHKAHRKQFTTQLQGQKRLSGQKVSQGQISDKLISVGGMPQVQASQLSDSRFLPAQRQVLAAQIGHIQGNQQLQRLMAPSKNKQEEGAPLPGSSLKNYRLLQREDNNPQNNQEQQATTPATATPEMQEVTITRTELQTHTNGFWVIERI